MSALLCFSGCSKTNPQEGDAKDSSSPNGNALSHESGLVPAVILSPKTRFYALGWGEQGITIISDTELDLKTQKTSFVCSYAMQDDRLRVVLTALGTQQSIFFRPCPEGLVKIDDGHLFYSPKWLETNVAGIWRGKILYRSPDGSEVETHTLIDRSPDHSIRYSNLRIHHGRREFSKNVGTGSWSLDGAILKDGAGDFEKYCLHRLDRTTLIYESVVGGECFSDQRVEKGTKFPAVPSGYKQVDDLKSADLWGELVPLKPNAELQRAPPVTLLP